MLTASKTSDKVIELLIVDDNQADVRLMAEALKDARVQSRLTIARDGAEALAVLRREGSYSRVKYPDLVLLDLNLPKIDGREVLAEIKADSALKRIPVVVFTTSSAEDDIIQTYNLHANCYITKPVDLEQFVRMVRAIEDFWFTIVKLPPK
ncbi:MAG TPA: response regulator [Methylomirabilota bacterium]|nr:response regulator [Methylomirabilota bacterium]